MSMYTNRYIQLTSPFKGNRRYVMIHWYSMILCIKNGTCIILLITRMSYNNTIVPIPSMITFPINSFVHSVPLFIYSLYSVMQSLSLSVLTKRRGCPRGWSGYLRETRGAEDGGGRESWTEVIKAVYLLQVALTRRYGT